MSKHNPIDTIVQRKPQAGFAYEGVRVLGDEIGF